MIAGVVRQGGRGVPQMVKQIEHTRKEEMIAAQGKLIVAVLEGDDDCKGLVVTSLYDQKPFYMMSMCCESVKWIKLFCKVYDNSLGRTVNVPFYRLNIVDSYNNQMGEVDVADQLRLQYKFDHWMRKRKWWWSMWMWCFQMLLTNSYRLYCMFMKQHRCKDILSHYEFQGEVAKAWIDPDKFWPKIEKNITTSSASLSSKSSTSTRLAKRKLELLLHMGKHKKARITDKSLCPFTGKHRMRGDSSKHHWPVPDSHGSVVRCQLHSWATNGKHRSKRHVMRCETCDVRLCVECFKLFHTEVDLVGKKKDLSTKYSNK